MKTFPTSAVVTRFFIVLFAVGCLVSCTKTNIAPAARKQEPVHYNHQLPKPVVPPTNLSEGEQPAIDPQPRQLKDS